MKNTQRLDWIDALRGFAIILVLIGHIPNIPDWLFKWIYSFHIPLFFVISGYLFNQDKWNLLGFKKFVFSRFRLYIRPFLIISLIIFIIEISKLLIFSNVIYWEEFFKYVFDYLKWILFQIDGDFCGSWIAGLWFLPTLFISSILILFISNKNKAIKSIYFILVSLFIIVLKYFSLVEIPWHIDVALLGSIYMYVGYVIRKYDFVNKINNWIYIIAIFLLANLVIYFNDLTDLKKHIYGNYFLMLLGAILLCYVLFWIFNKLKLKNMLFVSFGKHSILIIACNFIINYLINKLLSFINLEIHWFMYLIIECMVMMIIIYLFTAIRKRLFTR